MAKFLAAIFMLVAVVATGMIVWQFVPAYRDGNLKMQLFASGFLILFPAIAAFCSYALYRMPD